MIEMTQDGPFAEKADQLFPDRVRILGLGQTGAAVCDQLVLHGCGPQDVWVFDSDQQTIEASVVANRHLLGRSIVHGLGCSGDVELAREIVALEESRLAPVAHGCDVLILIVGLGGSTGVALAEHLIGLGHQSGAKVIVVAVQPFAFEGWARREKSVRAVAAMRREADSVLVLGHDRLAENPATLKNVRHGFHLMHQLLAQITQGLSQVVCKRGLIQLSFADVRSLFGRYSGSEILENCWAAHMNGTIHDCTEDLVAGLLASPFLSDESMWKHVDHAIVAVGGTRDLGLTDVQELVTALKDRLPVNIPIATSASLDETSHDQVRLTVLFATTAPVHVPEEEKPVRTKGRAPSHKTQPLYVPFPDVAKKAAPPPSETSVMEKTPEKAKPAPVPAPAFVKKALPAVVDEIPSVPLPQPTPLAKEIPSLPKPTRPIHAVPHPSKVSSSQAAIPRPTLVEPFKAPAVPVVAAKPAPAPPPKVEAAETPAGPLPAPKKPRLAPFPIARPAFVEPPPVETEPEPIEVEDQLAEEEDDWNSEPLEAEEIIPEAEPEPAPVPRRAKAKQSEMQFEGPTRGRFEKTHETIYNGENLDQPTFRRRGVKIVV